MSKTYLSSTGSALTAGARLNAYNHRPVSEVPFPSLFDEHFELHGVHTLAAPFIVSCPFSNPKLPIRSFPTITIDTPDQLMSGGMITLLTQGHMLATAAGKEIYAVFITVEGLFFVEATPVEGGFEAMVPLEVAGRSYIILTRSNVFVDDDTVAAGPAIVEVSNLGILCAGALKTDSIHRLFQDRKQSCYSGKNLNRGKDSPTQHKCIYAMLS
jgi:hypothetical protein